MKKAFFWFLRIEYWLMSAYMCVAGIACLILPGPSALALGIWFGLLGLYMCFGSGMANMFIRRRGPRANSRDIDREWRSPGAVFVLVFGHLSLVGLAVVLATSGPEERYAWLAFQGCGFGFPWGIVRAYLKKAGQEVSIWEIQPGNVVGPLRIGMEASEYTAILGTDYEEFKRFEDDVANTRAYERGRVNLMVDPGGRITKIWILRPKEVFWHSVQLLGRDLNTVAMELEVRGIPMQPFDAGMWNEDWGVFLMEVGGVVERVEVGE